MTDEQEKQDQQLVCMDCRQPFAFTVRDQIFYEEKNFVPPKRCKACRDRKKQTRESQGR